MGRGHLAVFEDVVVVNSEEGGVPLAVTGGPRLLPHI